MFSATLNYSCRCSTFIISSLKRFMSVEKTNRNIFVNYFGLSDDEAKYYLYKYKLGNKDSDLLLETIKYCKGIGYTKKDILKTPKLFAVTHLILEQHYLVMEEGGFTNIDPKTLTRARYYMHKPIAFLKDIKLLPREVNVAESFLKYINPLPTNFKIETYSDSDDWNMVHLEILQQYLKCRLNATEDDIIRLFRIHRVVRNKSFRIVRENIEMAESLGFSANSILKNGYLLHNYPKYTKTVLNDFPNLAGADMRVAMRQFPKLVMTSPRNFVRIYGILKEYDIPDETIRNKMNVFHMSPETVRFRLEEVSRTPELRVLFKHQRFLTLIVHHNRAKSRLSFLQQLQLKCASLIILGADNDSFDVHIREGKDVNRPMDVLVFLRKLFNVDTSKFEKKWKKHPFNLYVPFVEMEKTFLYLRELKYTSSDILQAIHIILYPKEKIEEVSMEVMADKTISPHISKIQRLNLIIYLIEKDHHFTGNGIWKKTEPAEIATKVLE